MVSEFNHANAADEDQLATPPACASTAASSLESSDHEENVGEGRGGSNHGLASLKAQPGSHHHFSDFEPIQLSTFVNARFKEEPLLRSFLPIDGTNPSNFFDAWGDGMLLSVLVNAADKDAVDLEPLRKRLAKPLGVTVRHPTIQHFAVLNDALEGCKNIDGLRLGFVGAEDFVQGNRPVILGVCWQLVRLAAVQRINIIDRPELSELFTAEELAQGMGKPGQEEVLLSRWFNHYLREAGSELQVWSFGAELADCVAYCTLLNAIDPSACPTPHQRDSERNAQSVTTAVQKMGIEGVFMTEEMLLEGDRKLNVMFCAQLLEAYPRLTVRKVKEPLTMRESISSFFGGYGGGDASKTVPSPASAASHDKRAVDYAREYDDLPDDDGVGDSSGCAVGLFSCVSRN